MVLKNQDSPACKELILKQVGLGQLKIAKAMILRGPGLLANFAEKTLTHEGIALRSSETFLFVFRAGKMQRRNQPIHRHNNKLFLALLAHIT